MNHKSILITGCSSGIGLCVARGLKNRGHRVFATARRTEDVAHLHAEGLESLLLDLHDSDSIRNAVQEIVSRTGGTLDALFNNAGYGLLGAVEDLKRDWLREQFETNVFGPIELITQIVPVMRRQGHGRIIQNSSVLGLVAMPHRGAYTATKYALEAFSDTLRLELAGTNIYVSLIEPGPIISRFRENAHAVYKRTIAQHKETSAHRALYELMENRLAAAGPVTPFTLPPEAVLKRVIHAVESRRPHIRYPVTTPTYVFGWLRRLLPDRAQDWVLTQASREEYRRHQ